MLSLLSSDPANVIGYHELDAKSWNPQKLSRLPHYPPTAAPTPQQHTSPPLSDASLATHSAAMVYIRQDKLPKLKEYKYSGVDHSLVSRYIMKPFYNNFVIHCFPMWMA